MKKLLGMLMITVLTLCISIPAFAEGTTATGMDVTSTMSNNTIAYAKGAGNTGNVNAPRAYATNNNRNWGWLGLLGLAGLAGLRSRERGR